MPLSINHYLDNMPLLTNQWNRHNYKEKHRQRLYLKDIDCPPLWHEKLKEVMPPELFYLNDSIGEKGGPGSLDERLPHGIGTRKGRGIARSGDLMSSLPSQMRAENLMCYIGHEGTYTPAHREMCASLGQNIMVEASGSMGDDGRPTKPGSSIWFMTETKDRHLVSEYWLSSLGHDIEVESHFAQINAWKHAPFTVYIVEQKVGDFLLIPPLAPHQVWNRGTRTMKVAWNRTTVETLELALSEALPRARMVCRDEQYKNKAIILFTLNRYSSLLRRIDNMKQATRDEQTLYDLNNGGKIKQLRRDFKRLYGQFHQVLLSECFNPQLVEKKVEYVPYDSFVTCSYCRCNIFNRFLTCKNCLVRLDDGDEDTYDICMDCYAMGRSCRCLSRLTWVEQFPWKDLLEKHQIWRDQIIQLDGKITTKTPLPLTDARNRLPKRTLAHICQEQLRSRPFKDPKKVEELVESESGSDGVNDDGTLKKKPKKKKSEKWLKEHLSCHICMHRDIRWKLAICSCGTAYCYGSLWRAFDIMPQTVMEDLDWKCPKCRKICNCTSCKRNSSNHPYEPNGTVLGHDTRKFADPRSVESLVDFSFSNIHWLKKAGDDHPTESRRIEKRRSEAAFAKSQNPLAEHDEDEDNVVPTTEDGDLPLDPRLGGAPAPSNRIKQAAMDALTAMDGLTQLEQDPEAFMAQAGIADGRFVHNGIDYEYPDPDATGQFFASTQQNDEENDDGEVSKGKSKKKNRNNHLQKVQSDAAAFTDDANRRFYLQQSHKTLAEAKKTGRLIIAKAAITGDSLIVRLRVDPWRLGRIAPTDEPTQINGATRNEPAVMVQSDLPKHTPASVAAQRNPRVHKKRLRAESDVDFVTKKQILDNQPDDNISISSSDPEEADNHESDEDFSTATERRKSTQGGTKRRSLPAYLARKSPVEDDDLPKELSNERRRNSQLKPSARKRQKPNPEPAEEAGAAAAVRPVSSSRPAPLAPMASFMAKPHSANGSEDGEFDLADSDIPMPEVTPAKEVTPLQPLTTKSVQISKPSSPLSSKSSARPSPLPSAEKPVTLRPVRPSQPADDPSDESSEFEAPPKPKTPTPVTESEVSAPSTPTPTPSPSISPEPLPAKSESKPMDKAALNRLAKQRAAAGEMISEDYESDVSEASGASSSEESLFQKTPKKVVSKSTPAKISSAKIEITPASAKRGRGRPRKSDGVTRAESKSVSIPVSALPVKRKSIASRGGRGKVKIVGARKSL